MFNLIKITNGRSNVPEPVRLKTTGAISYVAGCVYYLARNDVYNAQETEDDLLFIPLENVDESEGKKTVLGYIVTEGMVFETEIKNDYTLIGVGDTICFYTDNNGNNTCVEAVYGEQAKILSMDTTETNGKVLVALRW